MQPTIEILTEEQMLVLENAFLIINSRTREATDIIQVAFEASGYLTRLKDTRCTIKDVDIDEESRIVIQIEFNYNGKRMVDYLFIIIMMDRRLFGVHQAF